MQENKEEKNRKKVLILIIVPLLLLVIIWLIFLKTPKSNDELNLQVSGVQVVTGDDGSNKYAGETTKIVGDNNNDITSDNPYLYLINDEDNTVYLKFDIYVKDEEIYSSDLIEPGMMEKLDIYKMLPTGSYSLEYIINSYDLNDSSVILLSGVKQIKNITIS